MRPPEGKTINEQSANTASDILTEPDNEDSFGSVYISYNHDLCRFIARRMETREDVDDIAQEVYFRAVRAYRKGQKLTLSYIYKIASNLIIDFFRRRKTHLAEAHCPIDDIELESPAPNPEQALRSKQGVEAYRKVLRTLKPECRRAFILHRFRGLTYAEIADEMEISKISVKNHIYQALLQFRKKIPGRL